MSDGLSHVIYGKSTKCCKGWWLSSEQQSEHWQLKGPQVWISAAFRLYIPYLNSNYVSIHFISQNESTVYQETFEGENFCKFCSFVAIHKSFLHEIWIMASFGAAKVSNPQKLSPRKSYFSPICESFLPRKFPAIRYLPCQEVQQLRPHDSWPLFPNSPHKERTREQN